MKHTVKTKTRKTTTRVMALIIAMITALSAMSAFTLTASAASEEITYKCSFELWGFSNNDVQIKINGTDGSTDWYNAGCIGYYDDRSFSFKDKNVGEITGYSVKTDVDGCYFDGDVNTFLYFKEWVPLCLTVNGVKIYGAQKISRPGEYTYSITDNVYKVTIKTADVKKAGTDLNVNVTLNGTNGEYSNTVNTSKDGRIVLPSADPFNHHERGGTTVTMVYAPFDVLESITIKLDGGAIAAKGWLCESVTIEQIQGGTDPGVKTVEVNQWFATEENNYERTIEIPHN
ncbi:MAG: PLAT/LH2 domain-containing protein [Ruminococcus sp.]|nr:PLAT/LH2 domain-containing protein [Ruminococcus sp.]